MHSQIIEGITIDSVCNEDNFDSKDWGLSRTYELKANCTPNTVEWNGISRDGKVINLWGDWTNVLRDVLQNLEATIAHGNVGISILVAINYSNSQYLHAKVLH